MRCRTNKQTNKQQQQQREVREVLGLSLTTFEDKHRQTTLFSDRSLNDLAK